MRSRKEVGVGIKIINKIIKKLVNFKIIGSSKGKGRNKVKIGLSSTTNLQKHDTMELKKRNLFKRINLQNSTKYLQQEPKLKITKKRIQN